MLQQLAPLFRCLLRLGRQPVAARPHTQQWLVCMQQQHQQAHPHSGSSQMVCMPPHHAVAGVDPVSSHDVSAFRWPVHTVCGWSSSSSSRRFITRPPVSFSSMQAHQRAAEPCCCAQHTAAVVTHKLLPSAAVTASPRWFMVLQQLVPLPLLSSICPLRLGRQPAAAGGSQVSHPTVTGTLTPEGAEAIRAEAIRHSRRALIGVDAEEGGCPSSSQRAGNTSSAQRPSSGVT